MLCALKTLGLGDKYELPHKQRKTNPAHDRVAVCKQISVEKEFALPLLVERAGRHAELLISISRVWKRRNTAHHGDGQQIIGDAKGRRTESVIFRWIPHGNKLGRLRSKLLAGSNLNSPGTIAMRVREK